MNKKDFYTFIKNNLKDLPIEKQEELLTKITRNWMPKLTADFYQKKCKNLLKCTNCKKYSSVKNYKETSHIIFEPGVTVNVGCGYGDYDKIADVTYKINYIICPICGYKKELNRIAINTSNERYRCE